MAQQAISDTNAAHADAAGRTSATAISGTLDGMTLTAGLCHAVAALSLAASETLTLDDGNDQHFGCGDSGVGAARAGLENAE